MCMYCKFNTMRTTSFLFLWREARSTIVILRNEDMFTDQNKTAFKGRQASKEDSHITKLPW